MDAYVEGGATVNMFRGAPLVEALWRKGNSKVYDGGARITGAARFGFNPNSQWYQGADVLNMDPFESLTRYAYDWRMLHLPVSYTGEEARKNSGRAQAINLITERINVTMDSAIKVLDIAMAGDGSLAPGKMILGLDAFFPVDPTTDPSQGSVGDITAVGNTWWQPFSAASFGSFAANGPGGTAADNWLTAWDALSDGSETPDLIISAQNVFEFYHRINLNAVQINVSTSDAGGTRAADRSFNRLRYNNTEWFWSRNIPDGRAYLLRRGDLNFWVHPKGNLTLSEFIPSFNQDLFGAHLLLQCAFFVSRRMMSGVIDGITA